jgi:predicted ATPase
MLDSFLVKNYRLFEDLRIDRLRQVNLFVGKNNSGKTCLLEALHIYASNSNLKVLRDIIAAHDGNWEAEIEPESDAAPTLKRNPLRCLYHGYDSPISGLGAIEVGEADEQKQTVRLQTAPYQTVQEEGNAKVVPVSSVDDLKRNFANVEYWLVVKEFERTTRLARLEDLDYRQSKRDLAFLGAADRSEKYKSYFVPALGLTDQQVATLWDKVSLTDLQSDVLSGLQLIQPKISGIAFLAGTRVERRRIAVVRLSDSSERYPLKSMGEGLVHLLQITLALVSVKDGILLIDEFENGLHWTAQQNLWRLVFRLAKRLNVQVFATTHSQDCVKAFSSAWQDDEDAATFHRLDRDSRNGVKATTYDRSTLSDSVETEVEVR